MVGEMLMFAKLATVALAGILTALAVRRVMGEVEAQRAKVRVRPQEPARPKALRQDPATGVYYPAD
jgi:hypothetical protein